MKPPASLRFTKKHALTIMFGGTVGFLAYLWLEPPFLSYKNLPFPTKQYQVKAGQVIPLHVRRCSSAASVQAYAVTHELRSETRPEAPPYIMPAEFVTIVPGCEEGVSLINRVPDATPPDRYRVHGLAIINGPFRPRTVPWHSQPFEVVP
jgi:hypothetical protein